MLGLLFFFFNQTVKCFSSVYQDHFLLIFVNVLNYIYFSTISVHWQIYFLKISTPVYLRVTSLRMWSPQMQRADSTTPVFKIPEHGRFWYSLEGGIQSWIHRADCKSKLIKQNKPICMKTSIHDLGLLIFPMGQIP